jgi:hypothetical protein
LQALASEEITHALMVPVVHIDEEQVEEPPFFHGEEIPELQMKRELLMAGFKLQVLDH